MTINRNTVVGIMLALSSGADPPDDVFIRAAAAEGTEAGFSVVQGLIGIKKDLSVWQDLSNFCPKWDYKKIRVRSV